MLDDDGHVEAISVELWLPGKMPPRSTEVTPYIGRRRPLSPIIHYRLTVSARKNKTKLTTKRNHAWPRTDWSNKLDSFGPFTGTRIRCLLLFSPL